MIGPLVSGGWLADHLDDVVVVDVRSYLDGRSGREAYAAGHLPGARHLSLDDDLSDPASPALGRHPLPSPERFAAALGRIGVGEGTPVVAYDDAGGSIAARLWWLLHVLGEPVAVLDGGMASWAGPLTEVVPDVVPVERAPRPWPADRFVDPDDVQASSVVLDARAAARFAGGDPRLDPRPGHIPGATSAPWQENLDADGRFLAPAALRDRFSGLGVGESTDVVAYCGSGVTACHDLLALEVAGLGSTALYPGSWSQWGADASRPAETGP